MSADLSNHQKFIQNKIKVYPYSSNRKRGKRKYIENIKEANLYKNQSRGEQACSKIKDIRYFIRELQILTFLFSNFLLSSLFSSNFRARHACFTHYVQPKRAARTIVSRQEKDGSGRKTRSVNVDLYWAANQSVRGDARADWSRVIAATRAPIGRRH